MSRDESLELLPPLFSEIARAFSDHPEKVRAQIYRDDRSLVLEVSVHGEDIGRVIGRAGRTAAAMRALLDAGTRFEQERVHLEIVG
jgi:predicted RNA-binding protein YlqC (UPF0109 family)